VLIDHDSAGDDAADLAPGFARAIGSDLLTPDDVGRLEAGLRTRLQQLYSPIPAERARVISAVIEATGDDNPAPERLLGLAVLEALHDVAAHHGWDDRALPRAQGRLEAALGDPLTQVAADR